MEIFPIRYLKEEVDVTHLIESGIKISSNVEIFPSAYLGRNWATEKALFIKENLRSVEPPIPDNQEFLASTVASLDDKSFIKKFTTFIYKIGL